MAVRELMNKTGGGIIRPLTDRHPRGCLYFAGDGGIRSVNGPAATLGRRLVLPPLTGRKEHDF
jgi:hypothetical protein